MPIMSASSPYESIMKRAPDKVLSDGILEISYWIDLAVGRDDTVHPVVMLVRNLASNLVLKNVKIPYDLDRTRLARWQVKLTDASGVPLPSQDQVLNIGELSKNTSKGVPPLPVEGRDQAPASHRWSLIFWKLIKRAGVDMADPQDAMVLQLRPSYEIKRPDGYILENWLPCDMIMDQGPNATPPYDPAVEGEPESDTEGHLLVQHNIVRTAKWPEAKPPGGGSLVGDVVSNTIRWKSQIRPPVGASAPLVRITRTYPTINEASKGNVHWDVIMCDEEGAPWRDPDNYPEVNGWPLSNNDWSGRFLYRWTLQRKEGASEPGMTQNFKAEFGVYTEFSVDYSGSTPWSVRVGVSRS